MRAAVLAVALLIAPMALAPLAGCETVQTEQGARRALFTAALAYEGALDATRAAAESGLLKGENAVKAKAILDDAYKVLLAARATQSQHGARRVLTILAALEPLTNAR